MFYLIGQIAVTLLFTALIGITMGWLLRGLGTSRQLETIEARWRARVAQLERRGDRAGAAGQSPEVDTAADEDSARQIAELRKQVRKRDELLASLQSVKRPGSDARDFAQRLKETTGLNNQLQQHVDEQTTAIEQLRAKIEKVNSEREVLVERLRDREAEIGRMSQERQHAINTIASLQKEVRTLRGQQLAAGATEKKDTDNRVARVANRPVSAASDTAEPVIQQDLPIAGPPAKKSISEYKPAWRLSEPRGPKDNLQAIFGIGPKLEMQLNKLGIFHFEQIGCFERNDILWVAHHLKSFPGRIVRDRWIEQAQTLANQRRG